MSPPPTRYTADPITWPTGSKPTDLIAANSPVDSADDQVPLARPLATRAAAMGGSPVPLQDSGMAPTPVPLRPVRR